MLNKEEMLETYERLKAYPTLLERVGQMLDLMEKNNVKTADDFEEALIPQVRQFGKDIMESWSSLEERLLRKDLEDKQEKHHSKKTALANDLWNSRSR